jgi:hypothetical protein
LDTKKQLIQIQATAKQALALKTYVFIIEHFNNYASKLRNALINFKYALASESEQTKEMLWIYVKKSQGKATKQEMKFANSQFLAVCKSAGLSVFLFLPFSPITLPLIIKLGEKLGVDVLPDSFKSRK